MHSFKGEPLYNVVHAFFGMPNLQTVWNGPLNHKNVFLDQEKGLYVMWNNFLIDANLMEYYHGNKGGLKNH